ncbi:28S ribosomal protein S2, mitochondrial-like [Pocillopora damicornis]|uniref:28S ribosomal protein S2, mitochondrial-like n=1 Tax=Pocillopora damicornis TaxID=46731 RepID=UPI000F553808|nr:28S ribosomal protein S2, mitochondrial-like [Pocillopora damicornis]
MAARHVLRTPWNISPVRGKTIISSLLAPITRFRQACSIHTHSSILSSELSSAVETDKTKPDEGGEIVVEIVKELNTRNCTHLLLPPVLSGDINIFFSFQLALNVLSHIAYKRGKILFISAHPQFEELTQRTARECDEYFITRRWRGGTLTNSYMLLGTTELVDLIIFLHLPSLGKNTLAVTEAAQLNIPTIGIVDSDCNPNMIMYPIPGNDDTPSAVQLYCNLFKKVIMKAKEERRKLGSDTEESGENA